MKDVFANLERLWTQLCFHCSYRTYTVAIEAPHPIHLLPRLNFVSKAVLGASTHVGSEGAAEEVVHQRTFATALNANHWDHQQRTSSHLRKHGYGPMDRTATSPDLQNTTSTSTIMILLISFLILTTPSLLLGSTGCTCWFSTPPLPFCMIYSNLIQKVSSLYQKGRKLWGRFCWWSDPAHNMTSLITLWWLASKVPLHFKRRWMVDQLHGGNQQPTPVQLEVQREHLLESWRTAMWTG